MTSKFALVIANTEYQDASFAKLTAPGRDAEEFAQVLRELAAFDDVLVLLNEGEGKTRRSIARFFAERKRDDLLLLYFSGHGVRNEVGQLFLAANDTEINILEASGIPAEFVTQSMNNSRSQRQLLILDCCNSGAFAYGSKSAGVGKSMGIASAFEGSGFGRVVLTATDATQYAWEGDKVIGDTQKSVFTHFLIEGLKGEADRDSDGRIHVDELYDYTYEQVVRRTPKQTPGKWSYKQQGDIILRENLPSREVKPAPLPSDLLELLSHPNSSVRRVGIQDLISLLNGKHLGLARGAEEKLREIAENDDSFSFRRTASEALTARGLIAESPFPHGRGQGEGELPLSAPIPFEIPKEKQKEEKKVEKPIDIPPRKIHSPRVDRSRAKTPRVLPDWKSIASRFNLRLILGIGALLVVVSLGIAVFPALKSMIAPVIGSTMTGKDGMTLLYVPAGSFTMGSNDGSLEEQPVHIVDLDAFWIDQTEVTNAMYARCVADGVCEEPADKKSWTRSSYYGDPEFDNYPVISVDWTMAKTYCEWVDRRLPTEAEWEKAARGENANMYPWGNESPNNGLLNYNSVIGDTTEVGKYPDGASVYGALDMAGNVWEWVSSLKQPYPYDPADDRENLDASDAARVLRGGTWRDGDGYARSASRFGDSPTSTFNYAGFRCAVSDDEQAGSTSLAQVETKTPQVIATDTPEPTSTNSPLPTETTISPTPTSEFDVGSTMTGEDGMTLLYVPAGEFTMGFEGFIYGVQEVTLDAFWFDKTEVTNALYAKCVQAGGCTSPSSKKSATRESYYGDSQFDNYPVIEVSWNDAEAYCSWARRRLPTGAEWERAARGTDDRKLPWGNEASNSNLSNSDGAIGDTTEVGTYPDGASPYGALDMAGNVFEWVNTRYSATSFFSGSYFEGECKLQPGECVARGGAFNSGDNVYSFQRWAILPWIVSDTVGFRCAMSATP